MEQLNIEGKRSGEGFVAHKAMLVNALSMALSARVVLMDMTIGLKGFLGYLKALGGSNIVKVIPSNGSASDSQTTANRLKVICGANTSYLADLEWVGEKTPLTLCDIRVSPSNSVKPNVGTRELADALARVIPFTATDDARPVLQCVNFVAKEGKLTMVSADGFRLAKISLDYDEGEGQALISRDELRGVVNALRKAKRARVSFEGEDVTKSSSLIIDTEFVRYKWQSVNGNYPEYEKLIPVEFNIFASFDTLEASKAVNSLKVLADNPKGYPIDLTIGDGKLVMANPDDKGQADIPADTDGEVKIRIDGQYLADALRACGGMVDFKVTTPQSPMLFSSNGYQLVVMPMLTGEPQKAKADEVTNEPTEPKAKGKAKTEPKAKGKRKGKAKTEPKPTDEVTEPVTEPEPTEQEATELEPATA